MSEEWKTHPTFTSYEVSTKGKVRSIKTSRTLKPSKDNYGRGRFNLRDKDGSQYCVYAHRLVAEAFIDGFDRSCRVKMINGTDPSLSNITVKKTRNSRASIEDVKTILEQRNNSGSRSETLKQCDGSYLFVDSVMKECGLVKGYKENLCKIIILGIVAMNGSIKRKDIPVLMPAYSKSYVAGKVSMLIKEGKLTINDDKVVKINT